MIFVSRKMILRRKSHSWPVRPKLKLIEITELSGTRPGTLTVPIFLSGLLAPRLAGAGSAPGPMMISLPVRFLFSSQMYLLLRSEVILNDH